MMMVIRAKPQENENLATEIWNCMRFVHTYFYNKKFKVAKMLVCFSIERCISEITDELLFYSDAKTEMLTKEPSKVF